MEHASAAEPWHKNGVRLATFNIKHAELRGLAPLADLLREARPDLAGLQEVDVGCARSGFADQPAGLGTALGMASCFAPALPLEGGSYGNALLAAPELLRGEPLQASALPLPGGPSMGEEPRVLLAAVGDPHGTVVLGDLNEGPDGPAVRKLLAAGFRDAWAECGAQELVTAPWDRPQTRIDQVLLGPGLPRARSARALSTDASDHALVLVEL